MQPVREERRRGYQFSATIALDYLLSGVIELPIKVASPSGDGGLWGCGFHAFSDCGMKRQLVTEMASPTAPETVCVTEWRHDIPGEVEAA
jgi:hypothetical protein